ncbi:hypothetical protein [Lentibacillus jeotgali]|uniref:hypothetical protein n=1 Tax=Lentibacillus jeotgali TaxID=558169 RepID=UPI0002625899|nr:hypothetical protein [Lentibacillus jeotgali]
MVKKDSIPKDVMDNLLMEYPISLKAINSFLSLYTNETTKAQYRSSIHNLLVNDVEDLDVTKLTFNDYKKIIPKVELDTQQRYKKSFFQYLYAMDYLKNPSGFDTEMFKVKLISRFTERNKGKSKVKSQE